MISERPVTRLRTPSDDTLLIINDSENDSDLFYATGFLVGDPMIYLEHGGRKILLVSDLEYGRAQDEADVDEMCGLIEKSLVDALDFTCSTAAR